MVSGDQLDIHPNPGSGCYEAWLVNSRTREKRLISTCSLCVSEDQIRWWNRQLCSVLQNEEGLLPAAA
jgi:hypothetical protein